MSIEMRVQANSQPKLLELHTIQAGSFISTTQSLLNKYREPLRKKDYEKMQIEYESFYHTCNGVTLMGFDKIADFALRLDDLKPIDWTKSTRLATLWDAWQNDSLLLGRSKSITTLVGYCQLAYLVANKQSLNSTSKVIEALGVRQKKIAPLARFDFVPFDEELKQLIVRINTILGKEVFPKDFEPIWESERKIQKPVVRLKDRFNQSYFTSSDLILITGSTEKLNLTRMCRILNAAHQSPHASLGVLEMLASKSREEFSQNL